MVASTTRVVVLGLSLAALGFFVGVGYSLVAFADPEPASAAGSVANAVTMRQMPRIAVALDEEIPALRADVTEMRRLLTTLAARRAADPVPSAAVSAAAAAPAGTRELFRHAPSPEDGKGAFVRDGAYTADAPKLTELKPIQKWASDAGLRRRLQFTSERDVVKLFGAPDEIHPDASAEWWIYWDKGAEKGAKYSLQMSNGRLVDASYFVDPDKLRK